MNVYIYYPLTFLGEKMLNIFIVYVYNVCKDNCNLLPLINVEVIKIVAYYTSFPETWIFYKVHFMLKISWYSK